VVIYLVGFASTGKLTIARELASLLKAKIADNHWVNNPIFGLLETDGKTKLPEAVWNLVDAVHDTIATLSPREWNFIFTHAGCEDEPGDHEIFASILNVAERRRALRIPVRLTCAEEELKRPQAAAHAMPFGPNLTCDKLCTDRSPIPGLRSRAVLLAT
jgi:hypothetical protein